MEWQQSKSEVEEKFTKITKCRQKKKGRKIIVSGNTPKENKTKQNYELSSVHFAWVKEIHINKIPILPTNSNISLVVVKVSFSSYGFVRWELNGKHVLDNCISKKKTTVLTHTLILVYHTKYLGISCIMKYFN